MSARRRARQAEHDTTGYDQQGPGYKAPPQRNWNEAEEQTTRHDREASRERSKVKVTNRVLFKQSKEIREMVEEMSATLNDQACKCGRETQQPSNAKKGKSGMLDGWRPFPAARTTGATLASAEDRPSAQQAESEASRPLPVPRARYRHDDPFEAW